MSNSDSTTQSLIDRMQSFVSEHKRAVIIGTAAVAIAAGGAAYYASSSRSLPKADSKSDRKKDKKKSKKRKTGSDSEAPILEEVPKPAVKSDDPGELPSVRRSPTGV
jgi:mitochondrial import receptor subunit TOM70